MTSLTSLRRLFDHFMCRRCLKFFVLFHHFYVQEMHLICAHCRPKVRECPECRVTYQGQPRRHRSVVTSIRWWVDNLLSSLVLTQTRSNPREIQLDTWFKNTLLEGGNCYEIPQLRADTKRVGFIWMFGPLKSSLDVKNAENTFADTPRRRLMSLRSWKKSLLNLQQLSRSLMMFACLWLVRWNIPTLSLAVDILYNECCLFCGGRRGGL